MVGGVIGRDDVYRTILHRLSEGGNIGGGAEGRVHLGVMSSTDPFVLAWAM
jgi:hypothetical protein